MSRGTVYEFQWDPAKAQSNARKHGVTFDQAAAVFLDALALTVYDEANSHNEERWFTLGFDASGNLLAVAHTYEIAGLTNVRIRLISARKATRRERHDYETNPDR
jgi:uncharacterized DUF497 family protein